MPFQTQAWDLHLFELVNMQWRNEVLDLLMPVASYTPLLWVLAVLALLLLLPRRGVLAVLLMALVLGCGVGFADLITNQSKDAVGRVRPLNALPGVHFQQEGEWRTRPADFVRHKERGSSYPSGHAANSMALAMAAALLWPKARPWIFLLPLVVGYSRLYLGKHYPSDVLAGWVVGAFAAALLWALCRALWPEKWCGAAGMRPGY
jgi:membrane-associated phospholipid phosphatase